MHLFIYIYTHTLTTGGIQEKQLGDMNITLQQHNPSSSQVWDNVPTDYLATKMMIDDFSIFTVEGLTFHSSEKKSPQTKPVSAV